MDKKYIFDGLTKQYPLSKTLRFELKPLGDTRKNIEKNGLLKEDEKRGEDYKKAKKIIDGYHKDFIEKSLSSITLDQDLLSEFEQCYHTVKKNRTNSDQEKKKDKENLTKLQGNLRKSIRKKIEQVEEWGDLFKKELITNKLISWLEEKHQDGELEEKKKIIANFKKWTTYFQGFHENRKNVYSSDDIPSSIIHRIVHENLPKFLDNRDRFKRLRENHKDFNWGTLEKDLEEELGGCSLEEIFALSFFNSCLNERGIQRFNTILGGKTEKEKKEKIKGINEYINLFKQEKQKLLAGADNEEKKKALKTEIRSVKSLKMVMLYKQILSDKESRSYVLESYEDDQQVIRSIDKFYRVIAEPSMKIDGLNQTILEKLKQHLTDIKDNNLNQIYIENGRALCQISQSIYGDWGFIQHVLKIFSEKKFPEKKMGKPTKKDLKTREDWVEKTQYFSIAELEEVLDFFFDSLPNDDENLLKKKEGSEISSSNSPICDYFVYQHQRVRGEFKPIFTELEDMYKKVSPLLKKKYDSGTKELIKPNNEKESQKIKDFLDSLMSVVQFIRPLNVHIQKEEDKKESAVFEEDSDFYTDFHSLYEKLSAIFPLYNRVRNYITQKPYGTQKIKLNFQNSTLASGWDKNKERENTTIILIHKGQYFLGIIDKKHSKILHEIPSAETEKTYQKMVYKLLPDPQKMLIKVFFASKNSREYSPGENIKRIRNHATHTKKGTPQGNCKKLDFNLKDCHNMIDFFKESINKHPDWGIFDFDFSPTNTYQAIDEFYREVESQGYKIFYEDIDESYLLDLVSKGKLYLFQIYNKDFSSYSKGRKNLHTLYWESLFDKENLEDVVTKLNGGAEIFYRQKSMERAITHPKNRPINNKNPKSPKKKSTFQYDIIKNKRYTQDKFLFHVPITLNFKEKNSENLNNKVKELLKEKREHVHILGIDRGERHLAYYTLLDPQGKIIKQESFNVLESGPATVDYHSKLNAVEGDRDKARKKWRKIKNIKELKQGYLSQVVHKIARMVIDYNAIIVFEDLNFGFKRGRFHIEKQVYQKLEKMLIDKLNYLVFKDRDDQEPGGTLNAYQLTGAFKTFKELGKQTGVIFYVSPSYTSKICPLTGFVNQINTRYENLAKARDFFNNFKSIRFVKDHFEFKFLYEKLSSGSMKGDWTVCTFGDRLENYREKGEWTTRSILLTEELKKLLGQYSIDYKEGSEIKEAVCQQERPDFYKRLMHLLKLTLQLRNSSTDKNTDYIISPVAHTNGQFFDSRQAGEDMPQDADANGAYHIGLKGLWILEQLEKWKGPEKAGGKAPNLKLAMKNEEWFQFVQNRSHRYAGEGKKG